MVFLPAYAMVPCILLSLQLLPISRCITLSVVFLFLTQFSYTIFSSSPLGQCYTVLNSIFHDKERSYGTGFFFLINLRNRFVSIPIDKTIWYLQFQFVCARLFLCNAKACLNSSARPGIFEIQQKRTGSAISEPVLFMHLYLC